MPDRSPARLIRARLEELERNQAWLARKLGVDLSAVWRWLTDDPKQARPIPPARRKEISLVLGKGADWLQSVDPLAPAPVAERAAA